MLGLKLRTSAPGLTGWLRQLAGDKRGNTFVLVAAAVIPMLALIGGGIDMSRAYLSQTRLQQACDAGALAARKKLGSTVVANGVIPADANAAGHRFFELNFQDGAYGSTGRDFGMTLGSDTSITGTATASVPTTIMRLFGSLSLPVSATCSAQFNYSNTDIMMVLDTTGSMNTVNSGDRKSRIAVMRDVVKSFYAAVESNKTQGIRVRYGFVPYSTNVNVGFLLRSGWMVNESSYEARRRRWVSGSEAHWTWRYEPTVVSVSSLKGSSDSSLYRGGNVTSQIGGQPSNPTNLSASFQGCIEERGTYIIGDYDNVDLNRARDLDIDAVPVSTNPDTQWRPMLPSISWLRAFRTDGRGRWEASADYDEDYIRADAGFSACPARARKLAEMTASEVATYVDGLVANGNTYHDIGMIWGGRLISPSGIFASENGEVDGRPTMRHLIFLTDGQTEPNDIMYGTYGIEPLSQRRWRPGSGFTLTQTVENRFTFACNEVKNRNITVWVIGFGTNMNAMLRNCAGSGHWFQADNATQLTNAFATIAAAIGDLRIIK